MSRLVVDASVAVSWFLPEDSTQAALRLLSGEHSLLGPDLLPTEFTNALWKNVRRGVIALTEAQEALRGFRLVPLEIQPSAAVLDFAFQLAAQMRGTLYDSLYLATAISNDCRVVTADRKSFRAFCETEYESSVLWVEEEF